jgi:hypothetical protein
MTSSQTGSHDNRVRQHAGELWLQAALAEHASIASFARFAQELMALAAPPDLIAAALRAGLDEVEHAQTSFQIAAELLGEPVGPTSLPLVPPRQLSIPELALSTFEEACVEESLGALIALRAAELCTHPTISEALHKIAHEEAQHAELAWRTIQWTLTTPQAEHVQASIAARIATQEPSQRLHIAAPLEEELLAFGIISGQSLGKLEQQAWTDIVVPLWAELEIQPGPNRTHE